jgi:hypothetical protein
VTFERTFAGLFKELDRDRLERRRRPLALALDEQSESRRADLRSVQAGLVDAAGGRDVSANPDPARAPGRQRRRIHVLLLGLLGRSTSCDRFGRR